VSHPIQTQAVTYIVQRLASLAALFYLLSLVMYVKARLVCQHTEQRFIGKPVFLYCGSLISAVLAMKTKEIAFTLPVVIILYEFMFLHGKFWKKVLSVIPLVLTMALIPLSLMGTDRPLGDVISDVSDVTRVQTAVSRLDYLYTQCRVIITYLRLIVLPLHQNLDYGYPLFHSFLEREVLLSFLALLSLVGLSIFLLYRSRRSDPAGRLISFGILWFFITLSVESSIIPIRDVIFEHRMYLPSVGIFMAIAWVCFLIIEKFRLQRKHTEIALLIAITGISLVLAGITYARNAVWVNALTLWEDVMQKNPKSERAHNNIANIFQKQGLIDKAIHHYEIAIELNPYYSEPYNNLGFAYKSKGLIDRAIEQFQIAVKINPSARHYFNLGNAYKNRGLIDRAIENLQIAVQRDPNFAKAHNNLGSAYAVKNLLYKAREHFQVAVQLDPNFAKAHNNLGNSYLTEGKYTKAIEHYTYAISINEKYADAHFNIGVAYQTQRTFEKAIEHYNTAIRQKPDWPDPHYNLGLIYLEQGERAKARALFDKVIRINPQFHDAQKLLNKIS
jgi:tetratricopeptide (TPR) repeat protein